MISCLAKHGNWETKVQMTRQLGKKKLGVGSVLAAGALATNDHSVHGH